jgi:alpha-tubulin suppressor-like RCC1 family protein
VCALVGGSLYCWGDDHDGQVGDGTFTPGIATPTKVSLASVAHMALGVGHTCAVLTTGELDCWGDDDEGELGDAMTSNRASPTPVPIANVVSAAAGDDFTCATDNMSVVRCWGNDGEGESGDGGSTSPTLTPLVVSGVTGDVVAAGFTHACALASIGGVVSCWGENSDGQLGRGTTAARAKPQNLSATFDSIAAGGRHTCGVGAAGKPLCWGANEHGEVGDGTQNDDTVPTTVTLTGTGPKFAVGDTHTCVHSTAGVSCWGNNRYGAVGDGTDVDRLNPTAVAGLGNALVVSGNEFSCALFNGVVGCWGDNARGQLGQGTFSSTLTAAEVTF